MTIYRKCVPACRFSTLCTERSNLPQSNLFIQPHVDLGVLSTCRANNIFFTFACLNHEFCTGVVSFWTRGNFYMTVVTRQIAASPGLNSAGSCSKGFVVVRQSSLHRDFDQEARVKRPDHAASAGMPRYVSLLFWSHVWTSGRCKQCKLRQKTSMFAPWRSVSLAPR